jgi:hypothetical protein
MMGITIAKAKKIINIKSKNLKVKHDSFTVLSFSECLAFVFQMKILNNVAAFYLN